MPLAGASMCLELVDNVTKSALVSELSSIREETESERQSTMSVQTPSPLPKTIPVSIPEGDVEATTAPAPTIAAVPAVSSAHQSEFVYRPAALVGELETPNPSSKDEALCYWYLAGGYLHKFSRGDIKQAALTPHAGLDYKSSVCLQGYKATLTGSLATAEVFILTKEKNGEKLRFSLIKDTALANIQESAEDKGNIRNSTRKSSAASSAKDSLHFIAIKSDITARWMQRLQEHIYYANWLALGPGLHGNNVYTNKLPGSMSSAAHGGALTLAGEKYACFARSDELIVYQGHVEKPKGMFHTDSRYMILTASPKSPPRLQYLDEKTMQVKGGFAWGPDGFTAVPCAGHKTEFEVTGIDALGDSKVSKKTLKFRVSEHDAELWVQKISSVASIVW